MTKSTVGLIVILFSSIAFGQVEYGSIMHDDLERDYIIYVPSSSGPSAPLVIGFHGYPGTAEGMMEKYFMREVADTAGFIICYPNAINNNWNSGSGITNVNPDVDDVGFISALIDTLQIEYDIDLDSGARTARPCGSDGEWCKFSDIETLEAKAAKMEKALLSFKSQYSNSPWIINQVDEALKS